MEQWYPTPGRVSQLRGELRSFEHAAGALLADIDASLPTISETLARAANVTGFPKRQLPRWIWIASQLRLRWRDEPRVATSSAAALMFLERAIGGAIREHDVRDLNWVLESTVQHLSSILAPSDLLACLSVEEVRQVEEQLATYDVDVYDEEQIRRDVSRQLDLILRLSPDATALKLKVDALFSAAKRNDPNGKAARAALRYLADEQDVVSDQHGFLGLLDDVYVVEWAYAVVENQTRCLPLLRTMLQAYPYVGDLALVGSPARALDTYAQYVTCAGLDTLYEGGGPRLLVVREATAYPALLAFMAAVEAARRQAGSIGEELSQWRVGEHVVLSDGTTSLKVVFLGQEVIGIERRFRLGVRNDGSLTIPVELGAYIGRSATPHKRLSTGNEVAEWLRSRHLDPLVNLTGAGRRREFNQVCVLLLGPRHKLDEFMSCLHPLGSTPAALMGVRYVKAEGKPDDLPGSTTDAPYIYACSDAETAFDLLRSPPEHVGSWRVIADGARGGRALYNAVSSDRSIDVPPLCIISELHDREAATDLVQRGLNVWYLEDQDVEVPPLVPVKPVPGDDAVVRALGRQGNHWTTARRVHESRNEFLERVADWMARAVEATEEDEGLRSLELLVSAFVQRILCRPLRDERADKTALDLARGIAAQAALQRLYSPLAAELHTLFSGAPAQIVYAREAALTSICSEGNSKEPIVIVCRSAQIALDCQRAAQEAPALRGARWLNMEGLRRAAPCDRVVIPTWLDRGSMRELANNGYAAQLDFLLLPFERRWFDATLLANARWEKRIEQQSLDSMSRIAASARAAGGGALWAAQTSQRLQSGRPQLDVVPNTSDADLPEFEKLDSRAVEAVHRAVMSGREHHPTGKAQLVLFDDHGAYAYLPPGGKVIVLADRDGQLARSVVGNDAEKMLFRSVAALEPGFLLALPLSGDRDLIDARADQFLHDAAHVRGTAALWKSALTRFLQRTKMEPAAFASLMAKAGHKRDATTIRSWATGSHSIGPRNYRDVVPVLAQLTTDAELSSSIPSVLEAIDLIYRARACAAQAIVTELFAGEIDLHADELTFQLGASTIRYGLHRVRRIEGVQEVPHEVIGRLRRLAMASSEGISTAQLLSSAQQ